MAMILSASMMLEHLGLGEEGMRVRRAVETALKEGVVTEDLARKGESSFSTSFVGDFVADCIKNK